MQDLTRTIASSFTAWLRRATVTHEPVTPPAVQADKPATAPSSRPASERQAFIRLLADAYRDAVLSNADMHAATEALEAARSVALAKADQLETWDALDSQVGVTAPGILQDVLVKFRDRYVTEVCASELRRLRAAFKRDPRKAWDDWVRTYATALLRGQVRLCRALVEASLPFPPDAAQVMDRVIKWTGYVDDQQWSYTFDLLAYFADRSVIPNVQRAKLLALAAEVKMYRLRAPQQAKELLDQAAVLAPDEAAVLADWGSYWLSQGDKETARTYFERAINADPRKQAGYRGLGDYHVGMEDLAAAQHGYEQAMRVEPGSADAALNLIRLYGHANLYPERVDLIAVLVQRIIAVQPDSQYSACLSAGYAHQQNRAFEQAHAYFDQAIELRPARPDGYTYKGDAYLDVNDVERAKGEYQRAIAAAPELVDGYFSMALLCEQQERWSDALHWYEQMEPISPYTPATLKASVGELQWRDGRPDEAEVTLLAALEAEPTNELVLGALERLADECFAAAGERAAALHVYERILAIVGESYAGTFGKRVALVYNQVGIREYEAGQYDAAIEDYHQAIVYLPDTSVLYSNLAFSWEFRKRAGERIVELRNAIAALQKASAVEPDNADFARRLARLESEHETIAIFGEIAQTPPAAIPIGVEVAKDVANIVDPELDDGKFLYVDVAAMRQRVTRAMGVYLPPLRFSVSLALAPGNFRMLIHDIPVATGALQVGRQFCAATEAQLSSVGLSVTADTAKPARHPTTHQDGYWAPADYAPRLRQATVEVSTDQEFLLLSLQAIISRNLACFFGIQEAQPFLAVWAENDTHEADNGEAKTLQIQRARLLRTLLAERIPIIDQQEIITVLRGRSLAPECVADAIRAVRLRLKHQLPGNAPPTELVPLSEALETEVAAHLTVINGASAFRMPPDAIQRFLLAIRSLVRADGANEALVTRAHELRPYVQLLIGDTFPELAVLAEEEVVPRVPSSSESQLNALAADAR